MKLYEYHSECKPFVYSRVVFPLIEHTTDLLYTKTQNGIQSGISNLDTYFTHNACS